VHVEPIGHIRTARTDRADTPVQSMLNPSERGRVVLDPPFRAGLHGLDEFDYAWLLTWLAPDPDDPVPATMRQVPFLLTGERRELGLFAMRGPRRPNPIGLHLVRVVDVDEDGFDFAGVDLLDHTPLLDVKPYATQLDHPPGTVRNGWFDGTDLTAPHTPRSLRARRTE
jgi:tRNA-Thr(GGU) m(6)t(6)A37 methyltransferase TsaA